jgi:hypothetical protein
MTKQLPDAFVFMKVGSHAGETWEQILERKRREIQIAGMSFWGYGGAACHPLTQVQPFARAHLRKEGSLYLLMEKVNSRADPEVLPATEYSEDGIHWRAIPEGIEVKGSRYALILDEILPEELELDPDVFEVAVGPSRGKRASDYLRGRTDKGCLTVLERDEEVQRPQREPKRVEYVAKLQEPFAVLLR